MAAGLPLRWCCVVVRFSGRGGAVFGPWARAEGQDRRSRTGFGGTRPAESDGTRRRAEDSDIRHGDGRSEGWGANAVGGPCGVLID